jgi:MoxR-like ATPase
VLRHRIVVSFAAESEGISSDTIVEQLIRSTPSKEGELTRDPNLAKIFAA